MITVVESDVSQARQAATTRIRVKPLALGGSQGFSTTKMQKLALVGLGASGLFALKELAGADVEVHVFDVGPVYDKRYACPIDQGVLTVCPPKACSYCAP